jgi:hypothetical protein
MKRTHEVLDIFSFAMTQSDSRVRMLKH